jgi:hypothetical protein
MELNTSGQLPANLAYWFEHELRQYPATSLDLDRLRTTAEWIFPAAGRDSHGYPCREATVELGKRLGQQVIDLPGGHIGCITQPAEFTPNSFRLSPTGPPDPPGSIRGWVWRDVGLARVGTVDPGRMGLAAVASKVAT